MVVPKLLTSPCTIRIPRFMTDCCTQVSVEKETISAEILRKSAVQRPFAVSRISDDRMCEMFEMSSQLMTPAGSEF